MIMNKIKNFGKRITSFTVDKSPELLAIIAIGGVVETGRRAYKCRPKCDDILRKRKEKMDAIPHNNIAKRRKVNIETAKELIPVIAPVVIMGGISIAAIIFSNRISHKRILAVTAAYNLAEGSLKDLQNKMTDILGENKTREIKDAIIKDKTSENPPPDNGEHLSRLSGDTLCYDSYSGRYFRSSSLKLDQAILKISAQVSREMYVTLNDFYDVINSPDLGPIDGGRGVGWRAEDSIGGSLPITISAQRANSGEPCLCLDYNNSLVMV